MIKFRGKSKRTNEWIYGKLLSDGDTKGIATDVNIHEDKNIISVMRGDVVFSESVGQYTGLKDKNGTDIYEGDVVNIMQYLGGRPSGFRKRIVQKSKYNDNLVAFIRAGDTFALQYELYFDRSSDYEVAGNIYENTELLDDAHD